MYYPDNLRVRDAILPSLFRAFLFMHIRANRSLENDLMPKIFILEEEINNCFKGITKEKRDKLIKRLAKFCQKVEDYARKEGFDSRKCFLTFTAWAEALEQAGGIVLTGEYQRLVKEEMQKVIMQGYDSIEDFDKIDSSAISHVTAIHKLAQEEGYF